MTSLLALLFFFGFYMLYSTSKKADLDLSWKLQVVLRHKPTLSKSLGILLLVVAFVLLILMKGLAAGLLTGFIILMIASGLIVILSPLKIINIRIISIILVLCLFLETIIS